MPLCIVTDEATPPGDPPRPCPKGLRRFSPATASLRSGQYRRGYSRFACSLLQTKIIRNATPSDFGIGSKPAIPYPPRCESRCQAERRKHFRWSSAVDRPCDTQMPGGTK